MGARDGRAAIGLAHRRGLLFVAGGPTGHGFVYDARTGDDVADLMLTDQPSFVNDVTVTRRAAFFTDSRQQQLYRLPLGRDGRPRGEAETLPIFGDLVYDDDPETFEANGIDATPDGSVLLVVQSHTGKLFKIDARTGASEEVVLRGGDGRGLVDGDGLLLDGRTLWVVQNRLNRIAIVRLRSDIERGRITGYIRSRRFDVPTTVARVGSSLYLPNARFGTDAGPDTGYGVVRVRARRR